jgi:alkaline phosphatase
MKGLIIVLVLLCAGLAPAAAAVKHVMLFIADGWGFNQIVVTDDWNSANAVYETFPVHLAMSTWSLSTQQKDSAGYDPARASTDWNYVLQKPTDSAASATAMATGVKARNGALNVDPSTKQPLLTFLQRAEALGLSTGVVTSVSWSHATPAGFVAHDPSRDHYAELAIEMLDSSGCEVIMGCGHPRYDQNGHLTDWPDYRYVGGQRHWNALTNHRSPYTLVETRAEFQALMNGDTPARVCGTVQIRGTLEQERTPAEPHNHPAPPFTVPLLENVPTLEEMTRGALNVLDNNPEGFAVMIEGGAVDWACHDQQLGRCIEEMLSFNAAVQAAVDWVNTKSNWDESLIIVTGDHECGYLWGPDSGPPATWNAVEDHSADHLPGARFYSKGHTNSLIPVFAKGAGSEQLPARATRTDPQRGPYLDNTDIAKIIFALW